MAPDFEDVRVGIARARAGASRAPGGSRGRAARARRDSRGAGGLIYVENQYFAAPEIGEALAERLAEPDGPEVVCVLSPSSPSYFDRMVMDSARDALVAHLNANDPHDRFRAFAPACAGRTPDHRPREDHADRTTGSCAWDSSKPEQPPRSAFDTELDVAIEGGAGAGGGEDAGGDRRAGRPACRRIFLGCDPRALAAARRARGGLIPAIAALDGGRRPAQAGAEERRAARGRSRRRTTFGDPTSPDDPGGRWKRRAGPARLSTGHWLAIGALGGLAAWGLKWALRSERRDLRRPGEQP